MPVRSALVTPQLEPGERETAWNSCNNHFIQRVGNVHHSSRNSPSTCRTAADRTVEWVRTARGVHSLHLRIQVDFSDFNFSSFTNVAVRFGIAICQCALVSFRRMLEKQRHSIQLRSPMCPPFSSTLPRSFLPPTFLGTIFFLHILKNKHYFAGSIPKTTFI